MELGKFNGARQTTGRPIKNNDDDYIMLNLRRESQGCIHSFNCQGRV